MNRELTVLFGEIAFLYHCNPSLFIG